MEALWSPKNEQEVSICKHYPPTYKYVVLTNMFIVELMTNKI